MDEQDRVIDLTDAALARHRAATQCRRCGAHAELYRLIGTTDGLCAGCFADVHVG